MKKFMLVIAAALVCAVASAQVGKFAVGVNGSYYTDKDLKNFGIGVNAQYSVLETLRVDAGATYFLKKNGFKTIDLNLNVHYLFNLPGVTIYPLVGLNYTLGKYKAGGIKFDKNKLGFNAGAGVEVPLTECIAIFAECKYQFGGKEYNDFYKQFVPSIGVTFAL